MGATLVLHGGAGVWPDELRDDAEAAIKRCADRGWARVGDGALEAVVASVKALEDEPLFNSGVGAAVTSAGTIEHDAGVMVGAGLRAGGVGSVLGPRHPIDAARAVMEKSPHVLMVGDGALAFLRQAGVEMTDPSIFLTDRRRQGLLSSDTVGAVAVDHHGRCAVAVSTGGYTDKMPGRIGDSPIPGAGYYADDEVGASCGTGTGEGFMRLVLSRQVRDMMAAGASPQAAAERAVAMLRDRLEMTGGVIAVGVDGRVGHAHSCAFMPVAIRSGEADG